MQTEYVKREWDCFLFVCVCAMLLSISECNATSDSLLKRFSYGFSSELPRIKYIFMTFFGWYIQTVCLCTVQSFFFLFRPKRCLIMDFYRWWFFFRRNEKIDFRALMHDPIATATPTKLTNQESKQKWTKIEIHTILYSKCFFFFKYSRFKYSFNFDLPRVKCIFLYIFMSTPVYFNKMC